MSRSENKAGFIVAVAGLLLGTACAPALSLRMNTVPNAPPPQPDPEKATVVFLRPGGGGANAIIDANGTALGEMPTPSKLVVKVPPGRHTFYKGLLADPSSGDYSLFEGSGGYCHSVTGDLEAGKLYFVEASVFALYVVRPGDERLSEWAAAPLTAIDPARAGNTSLAADPEWATCVAAAREHAAEEEDGKATITAADAFTVWP